VIDAGAQPRHFLFDFARIEKLDAHTVLAPLLAIRFRALEIFFVLAEEITALIEADRKSELLAKVLETIDRIARQLHVDRRRPDVAESAGGERSRSFR